MPEGTRFDISVAAIYGHRTRKGMVQIKLGDAEHLMPPAKAREIAALLLEAAGSAEGDEALLAVLLRSGANEGRVGQVLLAMRQERARIAREAREELRRATIEDQFDPDAPSN